MSATRESLKFRYSILKWYYSVFVRNDEVGAVFRPLFFDFPQDENLYDLDSQFLIGTEIMAAPILYPNQTSREVYFPGGVKWFDFINCSKVKSFNFIEIATRNNILFFFSHIYPCKENHLKLKIL